MVKDKIENKILNKYFFPKEWITIEAETFEEAQKNLIANNK